MSTYRKLHGRAIKSVSSNLSAPSAEGQIWFNTTDNKFKSVVASKAFVSSTPYPTAVFGNMGAGTQTAALSFGGTASPSTPSSPLVLTLEYNGSGWSAGGDLSQKRRSGFGFGTQTAALGSTGYTYPETNKTEHYNGTSWTNGGNYPVSQELGGGCGTQTAGLACGGGPGPSPVGISNEYDGSSWTASPGALNSARKGITVTGIQTAGLAASAADSPTATACEEYNGSTWTTVNSMNTPRATLSFGSGIQTASILYGTPGSLESYDGTNWTNEPATMGNARNSGASAGTATASLASCGSPGAFTSHVEEYNESTNVTTAAAFSAGGTLNTSRWSLGGVGSSVNDMLVFGGYAQPPSYAVTEQYNGTSWSELNDLNQARYNISAFGTTSAAAGVGGGSPNGAVMYDDTEEWDGSSWTASGNYPADGQGRGSAGTQTAGLAWAGYEPPGSNVTTQNTYDGSSWTSAGSFPRAVSGVGHTGTATAALSCGGGSPKKGTEEYDGSSWTTGGSMSIERAETGGMGNSQNEYFAVGYYNPSSPNYRGDSEEYNGTSWASTAPLATGRTAMNYRGGTKSTGMLVCGGAVGGGPSNAKNLTEEYTAETTSLNVKTLTQS